MDRARACEKMLPSGQFNAFARCTGPARQRVRTWLQTATSCGCQNIDDCRLFDDPAPQTHRTPFKLPVSRITVGTPA